MAPVWAENNSLISQYVNQTDTPELNNLLAHKSFEGRLNVLDAKINDLAQSAKKQPKDFWDILGTLSVLISGIIVGGIGVFATYIYQKKQLMVTQTQTIQTFMNFIPNGDIRVVTASLRTIAMMNPEIAFNLAEIFFYNGGLYSLIGWSEGSDLALADRANQILGPLKQNSLLQALEFYKGGMPHNQVIETMTNIYRRRKDVTESQIEEFATSIDYLLLSQKKK